MSQFNPRVCHCYLPNAYNIQGEGGAGGWRCKINKEGKNNATQ